jgi:hypothetical protein
MKAFPTHKEEGMDLRDYFAAQAMQRLIDLITHPKDVATNAYKIADAMIEIRKTKMGD